MTTQTLRLMQARYDGRCGGCDKRIRAHTPIAFDDDARIAYHAACAPVVATVAAPAGPRQFRCRRCRVSGPAGQYPFSTNPTSYLCDDCGA